MRENAHFSHLTSFDKTTVESWMGTKGLTLGDSEVIEYCRFLRFGSEIKEGEVDPLPEGHEREPEKPILTTPEHPTPPGKGKGKSPIPFKPYRDEKEIEQLKALQKAAGGGNGKEDIKPLTSEELYQLMQGLEAAGIMPKKPTPGDGKGKGSGGGGGIPPKWEYLKITHCPKCHQKTYFLEEREGPEPEDPLEKVGYVEFNCLKCNELMVMEKHLALKEQTITFDEPKITLKKDGKGYDIIGGGWK